MRFITTLLKLPPKKHNSRLLPTHVLYVLPLHMKLPSNRTSRLLPTCVFLCFPLMYAAPQNRTGRQKPTSIILGQAYFSNDPPQNALVDFYLSVYFNILLSFYNTSNYRTGRFLYTRVIFRHLLYFYHAPTTARVGKNLLASLWVLPF